MAIAVEWWSEPIRRRCRTWHRPVASALPAGEAPFRNLMGEARWAALPVATRQRFARHVGPGACVSYVGEVMECRLSRGGWLLAQLGRLIGAPLPLGEDIGVAASVSVTGDVEGCSQYWTRQYGRRHGFPQVIHSSKRFAGPTGLEEYLGLGIGIALTLEAADGALLFVGDHYFLQIAGLRLRLPQWLAPGRLVVGHVELGEDRFAFTLDLVHPRFGELIHQLAVFADCDAGGSCVKHPVIVFDAMCVLCSANAQFVLRHDRRGHFRLASMQSDAGAALYRRFGIDPADPETLIVVEGERALRDSDAIFAIWRGLGWPWRGLAVLAIVPRVLRDPLYRWVARNRYRLFGRREICWMPTPAQRQRIL